MSRTSRRIWQGFTGEYIIKRENLISLFLLIDARHEPHKSDYEFMNFLGMKGIPFARIFTKSDKLGSNSLKKIINIHDKLMLETWDSLPPTFISSAVTGRGRDEILKYIEETITFFQKRP